MKTAPLPSVASTMCPLRLASRRGSGAERGVLIPGRRLGQIEEYFIEGLTVGAVKG